MEGSVLPMMPRVQKRLHRREGFSRLNVTTESEVSSLFGGGNCDANRKDQQVCASELHLPDDIREILQCAVRGHGKNAGHRLPLRPSRLQGPGPLALARNFERGMPGPRSLQALESAASGWVGVPRKCEIAAKSRRPALRRAFGGEKLQGQCADGQETLLQSAV